MFMNTGPATYFEEVLVNISNLKINKPHI